MFFNYSGSNNCDKLLTKGSMVPALLLTVFLIIFIGLRPINRLFGDTTTYATTYRAISPVFGEIDWKGEWLFVLIAVGWLLLGVLL